MTASEVLKAIADGEFDEPEAALRQIVNAAQKRATYRTAMKYPLGSMAWIDKPTSKWHATSGRIVKRNPTTVVLETTSGRVTVPLALVRS